MVLGAALAAAAHGNVPPPPAVKTPAPAQPPLVGPLVPWEYRVTSVGYVNQAEEERRLNALVADGWEVFQVVAAGRNGPDDVRFVLRRHKR